MKPERPGPTPLPGDPLPDDPDDLMAAGEKDPKDPPLPVAPLPGDPDD
jgi:hypothetical protein